MKKIIFALCVFGMGLFSSSCSKDITEEPQAGISTFNIAVEGEQSRSESVDQVTRYKVEAYENKNLSSTPISAEGSNGALTLTLKKNTEYTFLFWADGGSTEYTATSLLNVKPATPTAKGTRAYCLKKEFNSKDFEANKNVVLKGAVAQINFIESADELTTTSNTITVTYPDLGSLNVATGIVTPNNTATPITRSYATTLTTGTLASDYILADVNGTVADITVRFNDETPKTVTAIPLKANYRTNISGSYSNFYQSSVTVTTDSSWATPDNDTDIIKNSYAWYLKGVSTGEFEISTAQDLRELANIVNNTLPADVPAGVANDLFENKTIKLTANIDLENKEWVAIGNDSYRFSGVFDGNGKTISNLKISEFDSSLGIFEPNFALFGLIDGATIKELTINNVDISVELTGSFAANLGSVAALAERSLIMNIAVTGNLNISVNASSTNIRMGGLSGLVNNRTLVINCSVNPIQSDEYNIIGDCSNITVGGLIGSAGFSTTGRTINCFSTAKVKTVLTYFVESLNLGGLSGSGMHDTKNSYASGSLESLISTSSSQGNSNYVGGICGYQQSSLSGCFALNDKIKVTIPDDLSCVVGKACGRTDYSLDAYTNASMDYILNGVSGNTFDGVNGSNLTDATSAPWWSTPAGKSIVESLNDYVKATPKVDFNGTDIPLKAWKTGTSKACPAVFAN